MLRQTFQTPPAPETRNAPEADPGLFIGVELRDAQKRDDAPAWMRLAEQAGLQTNRHAIPALSELLIPPSGFRQRRQWKTEAWREARLVAIVALRNIGGPNAIGASTEALFDPDRQVRSEAAAALRTFGDTALTPLTQQLFHRQEWNQAGMEAVIALLGRYRGSVVFMALQQVLDGKSPRSPKRWRRGNPRWALSATTKMMGLVWLIITPCLMLGGLLQGEIGTALIMPLFGILGFLISCLFPGLPLFIFLCLVACLPGQGRADEERDRLSAFAAESLAGLNEKRALPLLLQAALAGRSHTRHAATRLLPAQLALLSAEDRDWISDKPFLTLLQISGPKLKRAILSALEFVGSGRAAAPVARLATQGTVSEICAEAARVLPILEARLSQERSASILLRASEQPPAAADQLLRPAYASPETPAEQLLRSSSNDG